jgi:hypothetical protein
MIHDALFYGVMGGSALAFVTMLILWNVDKKKGH